MGIHVKAVDRCCYDMPLVLRVLVRLVPYRRSSYQFQFLAMSINPLQSGNGWSPFGSSSMQNDPFRDSPTCWITFQEPCQVTNQPQFAFQLHTRHLAQPKLIDISIIGYEVFSIIFHNSAKSQSTTRIQSTAFAGSKPQCHISRQGESGHKTARNLFLLHKCRHLQSLHLREFITEDAIPRCLLTYRKDHLPLPIVFPIKKKALMLEQVLVRLFDCFFPE